MGAGVRVPQAGADPLPHGVEGVVAPRALRAGAEHVGQEHPLAQRQFVPPAGAPAAFGREQRRQHAKPRHEMPAHVVLEPALGEPGKGLPGRHAAGGDGEFVLGVRQHQRLQPRHRRAVVGGEPSGAVEHPRGVAGVVVDRVVVQRAVLAVAVEVGVGEVPPGLFDALPGHPHGGRVPLGVSRFPPGLPDAGGFLPLETEPGPTRVVGRGAEEHARLRVAPHRHALRAQQAGVAQPRHAAQGAPQGGPRGQRLVQQRRPRLLQVQGQRAPQPVLARPFRAPREPVRREVEPAATRRRRGGCRGSRGGCRGGCRGGGGHECRRRGSFARLYLTRTLAHSRHMWWACPPGISLIPREIKIFQKAGLLNLGQI